MPELLEISKLLRYLKAKGKPELVTVDCGDTIESVVKIMIENDFSQLPIMEKDDFIGVISFESIVKWIFCKSGKVNLNSCVEYAMKDPDPRSYESDLFGLMDTLANKSYIVLSKNNEYEIITNYGILTYFRDFSESFLIINDIENSLRKIISLKFDKEEFKVASRKALSWKDKPPDYIEHMDFSDYQTFISKEWDDFENILDDKSEFNRYIDKTRQIRNKVMHFRDTIEEIDTSCLKMFNTWLRIKIKQYNK